MAGLERIWQYAREDLVIESEGGQGDVFLWEHSARVARAAAIIAQLPEVVSRRLNHTALMAAALYHDAGWVCQYAEGLIGRVEVLSRPTSDLQRELGAGLLEERLVHVLNGRILAAAAVAVRQLSVRDSPLLEAQILAEADNLDAIGILSFWQTARRHSHEGKGIQAAIDAWQRQKEYSFWEARIADSFRFEPVRELAYQRLNRLREFMNLLSGQHRGDDVATMAGVDLAAIEKQAPSLT